MSLTSVTPANGLGSSGSDDLERLRNMVQKHEAKTNAESAKDAPEIKKRSIMDELLVNDHNHHVHHKYVLHPFGVRRYWDMVTTILVLYLCWRIPFDIGIDWWYPPKELKSFEIFADDADRRE